MSGATASTSRGAGALTGVANQTRREASSWWASRRWAVSALVWTGLVNGLLALILWVVPNLDGPAEIADTTLAESALQFTGLAAVLAGAGVVLMAQGVLIDDRRSGVVEWLLSKPLARPALIIAKLVGHAPPLVVTIVVLPWVLVGVQLWLAGEAVWPIGQWLGAVALLSLLVVFQLAVVLVLSTVTTSRAVVLAVPLGALLAADLFTTFAPWASDWLPWGLGRLASLVLAHGVLASTQLVVVSVLATVGCVVAAAWRFERSQR